MGDKTPSGKEWWNKVSGLAGKMLRPGAHEEPEPEAEPELTLEQRRQVALSALKTLVATGKAGAALALYHKTVQSCDGWDLPERELLEFTELICTDKLWNAAVPLLESYLTRYHRRAPQVRLKLAKILIEQQQRPTYASRVLNEVSATTLNEKEEKLRAALVQKAQKLIDDGVLELEGRPW